VKGENEVASSGIPVDGLFAYYLFGFSPCGPIEKE